MKDKDFASPERSESPLQSVSDPAKPTATANPEDTPYSQPGRQSTGRTSVSFNEDTIFHPAQRSHTLESGKSAASSIFDEPWQKQHVLSFDGGGIRGYSSLLIMRRLVDFIGEEELSRHQQENKSRTNDEGLSTQADNFSSYDPLPFPSDVVESAPSDDDMIEIKGLKMFSQLWPRKRHMVPMKPGQSKSSRRRETTNLEDQENKENEEARARARRSKYLPCHYFDYIGGTSTGGLISIMLGRLRMPIDEALDAYENLGGSVFGHPRIFSIRSPLWFPRDKYSEKQLIEVVKDVVEKRHPSKKTQMRDHLFMSHERMCKTIALAFEGRKVEDKSATWSEPPYLFRSYDHHPTVPPLNHERNPGYSQRVRIWQVARATTAAPTYFDSIAIDNCRYGDGGFGANNPIFEMYCEVCLMNGNSKRCIGSLISVGTGLPKSRKPRYLNSSIWKYLKFIQVATKLASESEKAHQEMLAHLAVDSHSPNPTDRVPYHRFNVPYKHLEETSNDQLPRLNPVAPNHHSNAEDDRPRFHNVERSPELSSMGHKLPHKPRRKLTPLGDMKLDEWRYTTLPSIKAATDDYLSDPEVTDELRSIAQKLVIARRARSQTIHWELYSTGTEYRCMHHGCPDVKAHKMRPHERSLRNHLRTSHGVVDEDRLQDFVSRGKCENGVFTSLEANGRRSR